jgi:hydroxymethylglutaryl-CoA reductase
MLLSPVFRPQARPERRRTLADAIDFPFSELDAILDSGGLSPDAAEKLVENVVGIHALPFALCLNLRINGEDVVAPMVIEEPSVVAAASYAARIVRDAGGFTADVDESIVAAQIHLSGVADFASAKAALLAARASLLSLANESVPGLVARGGGAVDVVVRDLGDGYVAVHVEVDCRDAMGANLVNTVAENVSARIAALAGGTVVMRILSNLADHRRVRIGCRIPPDLLAVRELDGATVRDRIVTASEIAARDPYRAATHNKGIMNGIDAVVIATGNDWRAVEAGAHAFAARGGSYRPLAIWHRDQDGCLVGVLDLPLAVGIVGGASRTHRATKLALEIVGARRAGDLAARCAAVGLASNLAALRALVTDGIQRGHMALHARSIALAAGARGAEVEATAAALGHRGSHATLDAARIALALARVPREEE